MYLFGYVALSTALATATGLHLARHSSNAYVACIAASEGAPLLVFANLLVALAGGSARALAWAVFGELRLLELEHIQERAWPTLMGLGMSAAMYARHENALYLLALVLGLLGAKVFTWITLDRLEMVLQRHQAVAAAAGALRRSVLSPPLLVGLVLLRIDYALVAGFVDAAISDKHEVLLVMAFEYFLVGLALVRGLVNFALGVWELVYLESHPDEEVWETKGVLLAAVDVILSAVNALLTPTVFVLFVSMGVVPLNLTGEIFVAFLDLARAVGTVMKLRVMRRRLLESVGEPSAADIARDDVCIVCRDEMVLAPGGTARSTPKKLPCGHVLHLGCVRSWLERANGCPVCRRPVIGANPDPNASIATTTGPAPPAVQPMEAEHAEHAQHAQHPPHVSPAHAVEHATTTGPPRSQPASQTSEVSGPALDSVLTRLAATNLPQPVLDHVQEVRNGQPHVFSPAYSAPPLDWTALSRTQDSLQLNDSELRFDTLRR